MRLTQSDTVAHTNSNKIYQRPSTSHDKRIRRNQSPASFCKNFALAAFSTFSKESAISGPLPPSEIQTRHHIFAYRPGPRETNSPAFITHWMVRVLAMPLKGSLVSKTRSAVLPASIRPTSSERNLYYLACRSSFLRSGGETGPIDRRMSGAGRR